MEKLTYKTKNANTVKEYFILINKLRNRDDTVVEKLMNLWEPDSIFEFAGSPPVVGTFKGSMAIQTLYQNRLKSYGMNLTIHSNKDIVRETSLGIVETNITHIREKGNQVIVGWKTTIGTEDGAGFDIAGSHLFEFSEGKIKNLRVNISPKADESVDKKLSLNDLSIMDVGRLSLAAWPVV